MHAELTLGLDITIGLGRVERLMNESAIQGAYRRKKRGLTVADPKGAPHVDLVQRAFGPDEPDVLWCMDSTEHPTAKGRLYLAAVLDAFSRRVVGWAIADHIRTEIVVDALTMARWRRQPAGTIAHSDQGTQYRSWLCGKTLRDAGCWDQWVRSVIALTTQSSNRSSGACRSSCSTPEPGTHATSSPKPSSNGPKPGATHADDTATATCSAPSTTKQRKRHRPKTKPSVKSGEAQFDHRQTRGRNLVRGFKVCHACE